MSETRDNLAKPRSTNFPINCSFCGKPKEQVRSVVGGANGVFICNECVDLCRETFDEQGVPVGAKGSV